MSIGAFAELAELTASALRFYDDAGVLRPARVDAVTGYRLYGEEQLERATLVRRLREIGMPLPTVRRLRTADAEEAARLIDEQVAHVAAEADRIRQVAAVLHASLGGSGRLVITTLPGPALAAAIDEVLTTTVADPERPVLGGVHLEMHPDAIALTATDRYRLVTRTLVPRRPPAASWAGTLDGDDLRTAVSWLRRSPMVRLDADERTLDLSADDGRVLHARLLTDVFPDHRLVVRSLPPVTHRVTVSKREIVRALEQRAADKVGLRVSGGRPALLLPDGVLALDGTATGPDLSLWFATTTWYPALSLALGSDVMLDLRGPDRPATLRSADDGDLATIVMPCRGPDHTPRS